MPHRCRRRLEFIPLDSVRPAIVEICLREICRARPADHGTAIRGIETQPALNADRQCGPAGEIVFGVEERHAGSEEKWRLVSASDDGAGYAAVEKLNTSSQVPVLSSQFSVTSG